VTEPPPAGRRPPGEHPRTSDLARPWCSHCEANGQAGGSPWRRSDVHGSGAENRDKCAWISTGQGATSIVSLNGANFAVQSLWSKTFNSNAGGCVISYTNATNQH
jgi:hypothetical protein